MPTPEQYAADPAALRPAGKRPVSKRAVASPIVPVAGWLLFGGLGAVLGALVGLPLGIAALAGIRRTGTRGKPAAWTGVALSALALVLAVVGLVVYQSLSGNLKSA